MDIFPTHAPAVALAGSVTRDAVANPFKSPKLLDVEMDQPARLLVVIAPDRLWRDEVSQR
jgi:hypothetical protein